MRKLNILLATALLSSALSAQDIYATFSVEAEKKSSLVLSSTGIVESVYVDVGDRVKKGQVLLSLDNDELESSVKLAQSQVKLAELNLKYAKKSYERFTQVKSVIDEGQYDQYSSAYERAQLELENAKVNLVLIKEKLSKTILRAPYNGQITGKMIEVGDGVSSAKMGTLFTMMNPTRQKLIVEVDEKYWKDVKLGQAFVYSVDGIDEKLSAKITKIYPTINAKKRSIKAEVAVDSLRVGLFGHGMIKVK